VQIKTIKATIVIVLLALCELHSWSLAKWLTREEAFSGNLLEQLTKW